MFFTVAPARSERRVRDRDSDRSGETVSGLVKILNLQNHPRVLLSVLGTLMDTFHFIVFS